MNLRRIQTGLVILATLCMGFYFGSLYTGMVAQPTYQFETPEWIQTVKSVQAIILGVFVFSLIGVVAIEHYQQQS